MLSVKICIIQILIVLVAARPGSNVVKDLIMSTLNKQPTDQQSTSALLQFSQILSDQLQAIRPLMSGNLLQSISSILSRRDSENKSIPGRESSKIESKFSRDNTRKSRELPFDDYFDLFGDSDEVSDEEDDYFAEKLNCTQTLFDIFLNKITKHPIVLNLNGCCSETTTKGSAPMVTTERELIDFTIAPFETVQMIPSSIISTTPATPIATESSTIVNVPTSSSIISADSTTSPVLPMTPVTSIATESSSTVNTPPSTEQDTPPDVSSISSPSEGETDITDAPVVTDSQPSDGAEPVEDGSPTAEASSQEATDEPAPEGEPDE